MSVPQRYRYFEEVSAKKLPDSSEDNAGQLIANYPGMDVLWGNGAGDDQSNAYWCKIARTIASATNDDLDLRSLAAGPGGVTVTFAEIRAIHILMRAANTTTVTMQPGAADPWTALGASLLLPLEPGSRLTLINPLDGTWPVTITDKVLRLANSAGAIATYDILLVGTLT